MFFPVTNTGISQALTGNSGGNAYTIQQGDTLSQIAARNGVSLQELLAANPQISNPNLIYPGDHLTIPTGGAPSVGGSVGGTQGPSGASGATPGTLQGRIDEAMAYFESQGWSHAQAAGIVGNLQAESGVDPNRGQDGGGPGYGLAQWEGPRQADFQAWAGHDIHQSTFREQLEFIQHELNTTESAASNALKNASTPAEAAEIFCRKYERPGIPHMEARIANANAIAGNVSPTESAPTPATPAPSGGGGGTDTVRSGDTMSAIAARNGVSLSDLTAANPQISNPNLIYPGQTINLPGSGNTGVSASAASPSGGTDTVRSGDTMSAIAARNGVSLSNLLAANPQISNPNLIYPGQTINLPGSGNNGATPSGDSGRTDTVRSGDTMSAIAARNGVSLSSLLAANPQISNPNLIYPGQTVNIPGSAGTPPPSSSGITGSQALANSARNAAMGMGGYSSQGLCATGVSRAIKNTYGIQVWGNGNDIDNNLPRDKFRQIDIPLSEALKIPGLVLTWERTSTAAGAIYGHTAITLGDGQSSASDFIERNTLAAEGGRSGLKIFMPI